MASEVDRDENPVESRLEAVGDENVLVAEEIVGAGTERGVDSYPRALYLGPANAEFDRSDLGCIPPVERTVRRG